MKVRKAVWILYFFLAFIVGAGFLPWTPSPPQSDSWTGWKSAGWDGGGCYPDMAFDPNHENRIYLLSDVAGIWRSDDKGDHWTFITNGLMDLNVPFLAVAPSDSNILYAGTSGGLYKSENAGGQWRRLNTNNNEISFIRPENRASIAVSQTNSADVIVGTSKGAVFRSVNGGSSWSVLGNKKTPFDNTSPITGLALSKEGADLYASSKMGGVAKYNFSSDKWEKLGQGPGSCQDVAVGASGEILAPNGPALWISKTGGASWTQSSRIPQGTITRVSAANGTRIAVAWEQGWDGGVFISDSGGQSWTRADKMKPDFIRNPTRIWSRSAGARVTSVRISPFDENVMFRTDWWGAWRSDDGGLTWNEKITGAPNTVGSDIVITPSGIIYIASMDNGLLASSDLGSTYAALFPKTYSSGTSGHVWRVAVSKDDKKIIGTSSPWNEDINQVVRSEDGGLHFTVVRSGLPKVRPKENTVWTEGYPRALAADPNNFNKMYLGIDGDDGGLFVSNDAGKTWARSSGQPGSLRIYNGLVVDPTDADHIYWAACGAGGGVYRSQNGGADWQYIFNQMTGVFDLAAGPDGTIYAAGESGGNPAVYVSKDKGAAWTVLGNLTGPGVAESISVDPKDSKILAVSVHQWNNLAGGKVFLSNDAGATWKDITDDLPAGAGMGSMAFSRNENILYALRYAGSAFKTRY